MAREVAGTFVNANGQTVNYDSSGNQWYAEDGEVGETTGSFRDSQGRLVNYDAQGDQSFAEGVDPFTPQQQYDDYLSNNDVFDATQAPTGGSHIAGVSNGPNTGDSSEPYIAWKTIGGATYGILPNGTSESIDRQQAINMGYDAPNVLTGEEFRNSPGGGGDDSYLGSGTPQLPDYGLTPYDPNTPYTPPQTGGGQPPQTGGGQPPSGGGQGPSDTSWNWDGLAAKQNGDANWGGYDEDYQAYERYQPGQESAWGTPGVEGGNEQFYRQQFSNLLRDDQGARSRARAASLRGQEAASAPPAASAPFDWSQVNGGAGIPGVEVLPSGYAAPMAGYTPATSPAAAPTNNFNGFNFSGTF